MFLGPTYATFAALALLALAASVLVGWHFDIQALKTVLPGLNSMKVNTALALLLAGSAVLTLNHSSKHPAFPRLSIACAVIVGLIGSLSGIQYLTDLNFGIDELFYIDYASRATGANPGQMSIITALLLTSASAALLAAHTPTPAGLRIFVSLTTFGLVSSYLLLLVFAYGAPIIFMKVRASSVAIHTVISFILLFTALAATRPESGFMGRLNSRLPGGVFVRRLSVAVLLGVPALGWLQFQGELIGWYDNRVGMALFAAANVVLIIAVIWIGGYNTDRDDSRRLREKVNLQQSLAAYSAEALTAGTIAELYKITINRICGSMNAKYGSLVDVNEAADTMEGLHVFSMTDTRFVTRKISDYPADSILRYAIKNMQPFWFADKHNETRFSFNDQVLSLLRSGATIPIAGADGVVRLLSIFYDQPHEFTVDEIEFMQSVANTLMVAHDRRRVADALNTRMARSDALVRLSEQALGFSTVRELSQAAIDVAFTSMGADYGSLAELDPESGKTFVLSMEQGGEINSGSRVYSSFPPKSLIRYAMQQEDAVWFSDIDDETRFEISTPVMQRYKSGILVPVAGTDDRPRRLTVYFDKPRDFTLEDIVFMSSIAAIVATAHARIRIADELKAQNVELEKADRIKSQFLAMMSHELRTPMTGLLGMADLLMTTPLNAEQQQMTQRLTRSGRTLLDILNDILDFSKLDADKMTLERVPFTLSEMLADLRDLFAPIASEKGLVLAFALPAHFQDSVIGDAKRVRQVITNLLNNALKFTTNGRVSVTLEQSQNADKTFATRISVSDTGIGIEPDKLSLLFKPFAQADASTSRKFGGTGLGLAICQKLVTLMGGEIAVSSKLGQGSTFAFTLALDADRTTDQSTQFVPLAPRSIAVAPPDEVMPARALRILLAEDNETNRMLVTAMLEKKGHTVESVENGQLAVDAVSLRPFDIILMDMQMPVMDGVEAMKLIRASEAISDDSRMPIIALTADVVTEHAKGYLQAGADAIVPKPVNWPMLFAEIDRQVTKAKAA